MAQRLLSYNARMRTLYPTLAHLYPDAPTPGLQTRSPRSKSPVTHRRGINGFAYCGTRGQYVHTTDDEEKVTCSKCAAGHFARK
jgi:hypothetical protein